MQNSYYDLVNPDLRWHFFIAFQMINHYYQPCHLCEENNGSANSKGVERGGTFYQMFVYSEVLYNKISRDPILVELTVGLAMFRVVSSVRYKA